MWICLNNGFYSIVEDRQQPGNLLVRARSHAHLKAFLHGISSLDIKPVIHKTPKADYRFRVSLPKMKVVATIANRVEAINYDNFKDSVQEDDLHDMYSLWWGDHHKYQQEHVE